MRTSITTVLELGLMATAASAARADTYARVNKSSGTPKIVASCTPGQHLITGFKNILACLMALAFLIYPNVARAQNSRNSVSAYATSDKFTQSLIRGLTAKKFQVSKGYPEPYTFQNCVDYTYPSLKNCLLANPAAPYVTPVVKLWPDEYMDPAMANAFVEADPGYSMTYRLDPMEAIIIYGQMPPPGRYMGLQTWEVSESGKWKPKDYNQWANTPDPAFPNAVLV
jgi:hypothetical protein